MVNSDSLVNGARTLLSKLGSLGATERALIILDGETKNMRGFFETVAQEQSLSLHFAEVPVVEMHGEEPPSDVAESMLDFDLVVGLREKSMAHTQARRKATENGVRYLSLPDYSLELLAHPALQIDYPFYSQKALNLARALTRGSAVHIATAKGTNIRLNIEGRSANFCPGYVSSDCLLGSPPDIETNISPVEEASQGVVVIDGSVAHPQFGVLKSPLVLMIENGLIEKIEGEASLVSKLEALFNKFDRKARYLAECGIGFNPAAKLNGTMLMDEGCYGTFHFGFGSNDTVGGKNAVPFHLDFVFYCQELSIDGVPYTVS